MPIKNARAPRGHAASIGPEDNPMRQLSIFLACCAAAALSACASSTDVNGLSSDGMCLSCHGSATRASAIPLNRAAPFLDAEVAIASHRAGAHETHLTAGALSNAFACSECHVVPDSSAHADLSAANAPVVFDPLLAGTGGVTASYAPAPNSGGTCTTYCHSKYAPANTPTWVEAGTQGTCDTCHASNGAYGATLAFTGFHLAHRCLQCHGESATDVGCFACHAGFTQQLGSTQPSVNQATHVDGKVGINSAGFAHGNAITITFDPATKSCSTNCHTFPPHNVDRK